jgi:hypothetical protein
VAQAGSMAKAAAQLAVSEPADAKRVLHVGDGPRDRLGDAVRRPNGQRRGGR